MSKISKVTLGADPEFFLRHKITGTHCSGIGIIGGTKDEPRQITKKGHFVQEDNVLGEFNIPPCSTEKDFIDNLNIALKEIKKSVLPSDLEMDFIPSARLPWEELMDEAAGVVGCDPDINAWLRIQNEVLDTLELTNLRTAGGHIHVGYDKPDDIISYELVKAMDLFLAVPAILIDKDTQRRELYGNAGACRIKEYGVEYRTLSNFWVADNSLMSWAYRNTMRAIDYINAGNSVDEEDGYMVQETINDSDKKFAKILIEKFDLEVIKVAENNVERVS